MDLKTPGSGEVQRNDWSNLARLRPQDEVKLVIVDRRDYEWARDLIRRENLPSRCRAVLLSPVVEQPAGAEIEGAAALEPRLLAQWILEDGLPARMQLQMHKLIWEPQTRGV
jgi:7-carboxy-7-deazaguanine synthase